MGALSMRRVRLVLTGLGLVLLMVLSAACGSSDEAATTTGGDEAATTTGGGSGTQTTEASGSGETLRLTAGTSSAGGAAHVFGTGVAEVINSHVEGVQVTAQASGGSGANAEQVAAGEMDMGVIDGGVALGYQDDLRAVFGGGDYAWHIIVPTDSGWTSLADLEGKSVTINSQDTGGYKMSMTVLGALGIDPEEYFGEVRYLTGPEQVDAYQNGRVDVVIQPGPVPQGLFLPLASVPRGMSLVPLTAEEQDTIVANAEAWTKTEIPAGSYEGLEETIPTVSVRFGILVNKDFPEDVAYDMAKALAENHDQLLELVPFAGHVTAEATIESYNQVPLHPGAEKYFKEAGFLDG